MLEGESLLADKGAGGALIKATGGKPETGAAPLSSSHSRDESKTPGCVDTPTDPDPPTEPLDRPPPPPNVTRPQQHSSCVVHEDDYGADPVVEPSSAAT